MEATEKPARRRRIGCLLLALIPFGCCLFPFIPRGPYYEPPKTIGIRETAQGKERIIREVTYTVTGPFPGPHGSSLEKNFFPKYYFEQPGKPRTELTFLRGEKIAWYTSDGCRPVDDTPLWVTAQQVHEPHPEHELDVLVFDENGIRHRRRLPFSPDWYGNEQFSRFESRNRTLIVRREDGAAYDVAKDTVPLMKSAKK